MAVQQAYHWQSLEGTKKSTVDDLVLLPKISESAITANLRKRLLEDQIYTYIGPVLIAVNPFKHLAYYGEKEIFMYQGAAQYEVPPHIYALADNMYRNMLIDNDNQCVIISGESGAGKTVSAKFLMNYVTHISGGGSRVKKVKDVILKSNPLLEAFGNAKTIRNNNSSRFGKYIEIEFSKGGEPQGGKISNFLLEKSRVHFLNEGERNFHIFYQICAGASEDMKSELGITTQDYYNYLSKTGVYKVDGTDDGQEFQDTLNAMEVMNIDENTRMDILKVIAAILHIGNISFIDNGNNAEVEDPAWLQYPAYLLGIDQQDLNLKLTSRTFDSKWGSRSESLDVPLNSEQAQFTRDAWAKGLYTRVFDYIVEAINKAMVTDSQEINLAILDIYGFEIFSRNGFEQFCINYVNEKLQQIFIELTLKNEQEEYKQEGIQWKSINFFNNKIVCDLIECRRPPGIFSVLDDTCVTMSAVSEGADNDFKNKMTAQIGSHPHYLQFKDGFTVKHYAGNVSYHVEGFCEKNRDVLFVDIIKVMQSSSNAFIKSLFPENLSSLTKGRPSTSAMKIRTQANSLVDKLSACVPHYIRCIKPNETKKPKDWNNAMVTNQVEYLGLIENIKIKRSGFAYRRPFAKFLSRYAILSKETWPHWSGDEKEGISIIFAAVNMDRTQYQFGVTKCFIKDPESLYMLEECRERKFDHYAIIIQKAFRKYFSKQRLMKEKIEAAEVLLDKKGRRHNSINRLFYGDYLGVQFRNDLRRLIPRSEKVEFAQQVNKYDRRFKHCKRDLILTKIALYLIGREQVKKGPNKGQFIEILKRKIQLDHILQVTMSTMPDNFVLIDVKGEYESLLEIPFKTEFLMVLNRKMMEVNHHEITRKFVDTFQYKVKKTRFGLAGTRKVSFSYCSNIEAAVLNPSGSTLHVKVFQELPRGSRPTERIITSEIRMHSKVYHNNNTSSVGSTTGTNQQFSNTSSKVNLRFPKADAASAKKDIHSALIRLPTANQRWPPNDNRGGHIVPPPPNQPAPADQPQIVNRSPAIQKKPKLNTYKALYEYRARDIDELTFDVGDFLEVIEEDDSGWWHCNFRGKIGLCPGNYLEKV